MSKRSRAVPRAIGSFGDRFARRHSAKRSRQRRFAWQPQGGELLEFRACLDSTVVINEIMYNPLHDDAGAEWIELYNQMSVEMELSGWSLSGAIDYSFAEGTRVPGGGYLVVASDPARWNGLGVSVLGPFTGSLANGGEEVRLVNNSGRRMNEVAYGDDGDWPVGADGSGVSLAKLDPNTSSEAPAHWAISAQLGGTPGRENFPVTTTSQSTWRDVVSSGSAAHVRIPTSATDMKSANTPWYATTFDERAAGGWIDRTLGVGFDVTGDATVKPSIDANGDLQSSMYEQNASALVRTEFTLDHPSDLEGLRLSLDTNDGYVTYLNGHEVARYRAAPGDPTFNAAADARFPTAPPSLVVNFRADDPALRVNDQGAVVSWPDLAGVAQDASSFGTFATPQRVVTTIQGVERPAVRFTGKEILEANQPLPAAQGTIFVVMKASGGGRVVGWEDSLTGQGGVGLSPNLGNRLHAVMRGPNGQNGDIQAPVRQPSDTLETITLSWGPNGTQLYRNLGEPTSTLVGQKTTVTTLNDLGYRLHLGGPGDVVSAEAASFFRGDLFEIRVYDQQLTESTSIRRDVVETELYHRWLDPAVPQPVEDRSSPSYVVHRDINLGEYLEDLRPGKNVLAIQGLNDAANDRDFLLKPTLSVREPVPVAAAPGQIVVSEVSSAIERDAWLELTNQGAQSISLEGYSLTIDGETITDYSIPGQVLAPGQYLVLTERQIGRDLKVGDKVFLYAPQRTRLADAVKVSDLPHGRTADGRWQVPHQATPGAANEFSWHDEIVINEIMYHHAPVLATPDTPTQYKSSTIVPMTARWRYQRSGDDLGTSWYRESHGVDNVKWFEGPALLGVDTPQAILPAPGIQTLFPDPTQSDHPFVTYYFETDFSIAGLPRDVGDFELQHVIDDGAVFFINGTEFARHNMSGSVGDPVASTDVSSVTVSDAVVNGPVTIPTELLREGNNRLSVEVHQRAASSNDIVFGAKVVARKAIAAPRPGTRYHEDDEEWIELYHRGQSVVDLSGWKLRDAINFEFPKGFQMKPGEYVVIARDAQALAARYPQLRIAGSYQQSLANGSDRIVLLDEVGNQADEVEYYDGGRWSGFADGGGSSLELIDADADNRRAEAWAPSDEGARSSWQTYVYRDRARADTGPVRWNEFLLGLFDAGDVLIDDVSVIAEPDGEAKQLIQNGSFESDGVGEAPSKWRVLGTHEGTVVVDPTDATNHVLRLVATGPTDEQHNKAETTLVDDTPVVNGTDYEFRFRAKWLAGSRQLNARFYVARVARTFILDAPDHNGTPGAANSRRQDNLGPTYDALRHEPAIPDAFQPVTVSVRAEDPEAVDAMWLRWRTSSQGEFHTVVMQRQSDRYVGQIPGQASATVVQFYVEGRDARGATSTFPASGSASRALYIVDDGRATDGALHNFRFIMFPDEAATFFINSNLSSNRYLGGTVVDDDHKVFYDVGVHIHGSPAGRTLTDRQNSFTINFGPDQPFRGVHDVVTLDTSGASGVLPNSQDEILATHLLNHVGGGPSIYNDLVHMIMPNNTRNGTAILMLARYSNLFLEEQFGANSDGTIFDFNKIVGLSLTDDGTREGRKLATGWSYHDTDLSDLGDDKELYRWNISPKNRRDLDDYSAIIAMSKAFSAPVESLEAATQATMDMDSWFRTFAFQSLVGNLDVYTVTTDHNLRMFVRPDNQKVMGMVWDLDHSWRQPVNQPLYGTRPRNLTRIFNLPANRRQFLGHLQDMMNTTFNVSYVTSWANSLGATAGQNFSGHIDYVARRANFVTSQLARVAPEVGFELSTSGPLNVGAATSAPLAGTGWINVRRMQLVGREAPLDLTWRVGDGASYAQTWQATIPVVAGTHEYTLQAYDFRGKLIGAKSITITSTPAPPVPGDLSGDQRVDVHDVDQLLDAIRLRSTDPIYDLNGDLRPTFDDLSLLVVDILGSAIGDANLDGSFDEGDLLQVFASGQYEDGRRENSHWGDGDWNGDGEFNSQDLVIAFQSGGYGQGRRVAPRMALSPERLEPIPLSAVATDRALEDWEWMEHRGGRIRMSSARFSRGDGVGRANATGCERDL